MGFVWRVQGRRPALKYLCGEEEIDQVSLTMMTNNQIDGLVPASEEEDGILYLPAGEPLDRLAARGERLPMRRIVADLAAALSAMEGHLIGSGCLLTEPGRIFLDRISGKTEAVCLPLKTGESDAPEARLGALVEALAEEDEKEILLAALDVAMEDGRLSAAKLAEALRAGLKEESAAAEGPAAERGPAGGEPTADGTGLTERRNSPVWEDPFWGGRDPLDIPAPVEDPREKKKGGLFRRRKEERPRREEETRLLTGSEGETVLLMPPEPEASLIRLSTGEIWPIRESVFRIGKDPEQNECGVPDNPAVSRTHAVILRRGGAFYLVDRGSTNGTRIGGRRLKKSEEARLGETEEFFVADEAFRFARRDPALPC